MTQPAQAQITGNAPAKDQSVESLLGEELKGLSEEIDQLLSHGLSDEEAQSLLDWAAGIEGKVKAVAALFADPTPATVAKYLRYVASAVSETRSRRSASTSLRLLQAVLDRSTR